LTKGSGRRRPLHGPNQSKLAKHLARLDHTQYEATAVYAFGDFYRTLQDNVHPVTRIAFREDDLTILVVLFVRYVEVGL
jgi:hypothetical protein